MLDPVLTLVGVTILCSTVFAFIKAANDAHWLLGAFVTAFYAYGAHLGVADLRARRAPLRVLHQGLAATSLTAFSAIAVAASVSLMLLRAGWASYEPMPQPDQAYVAFTTYYVWVLLDMLPGLKATELLAFDAPTVPKNALAGIPVIAFRAFIVFGLLAALRVWWRDRRGDARDEPV